MCGFIATIGFDINKNTQKEIIKFLSHRGPDYSSTNFNKKFNAYVFFNRLAINDLSRNGNMPFFIQNKKILMVANCEIYNFKLLKDFLISKNYKFKSNSDAEVIIKGYQYYGEMIFKKIKGMFTILILDETKNKIFIARDNLGIKPLYFYRENKSFIFSSEFLPILKIKKKLKLKNKLITGYSINSRSFDTEQNTIISDIFKFDTGSFASIENSKSKMKVKKIFHPKFNKINMSYSKKIEIFGDLLEKSLKTHMISDRPVSVLLSGGIDSSLLAVMAKKINKNIDTYTIDVERSLSDDDKNIINRLSQDYEIRNKIINISYYEIMQNIEKIINIYDDLSSFDGGFITNYLLSKKIKNKSKVILVGDGADELLAGYSWFGLSKYPFKILSKNLKKRMLNYIYSGNFLLDDKFNNNFEENLKHNGLNFFDRIRLFELTKQLPNSYLTKVDRSTMANSIEARVPYLDNDLIEFCLKLNDGDLIDGNFYFFNSFKNPVEKKILRDFAKNYLPNEIVYKKKKGFSLSPKKMLYSNLTKVESIIFDNNAYSNNFFDKSKKKQIYNNFINSSHTISEKKTENLIWKIFITDIWFKKFIQYID